MQNYLSSLELNINCSCFGIPQQVFIQMKPFSSRYNKDLLRQHTTFITAMPMKNATDTIGNRTRYLPACITVPQTTAITVYKEYYICCINAQ